MPDKKLEELIDEIAGPRWVCPRNPNGYKIWEVVLADVNRRVSQGELNPKIISELQPVRPLVLTGYCSAAMSKERKSFYYF